jgi:polyisoprenyl-phosphate glycosyltransferase
VPGQRRTLPGPTFGARTQKLLAHRTGQLVPGKRWERGTYDGGAIVAPASERRLLVLTRDSCTSVVMQLSVDEFNSREHRKNSANSLPGLRRGSISQPHPFDPMEGSMVIGMAPSTVASPAVALSAVVPCFNEEAGLPELYSRLSRSCREVAGDSYEVVLVDDGSTDRTWRRIQELAKHDPHVVGVALSRNHGHQLALTAGLSVCSGDRVLILDADLQDPPELVGDMMALMDDEGADVVYGQRLSRDGETWHKKATASLFYRLLAKMTDLPIPSDTGDFRLMTRRALHVLQSMPEQHRFIRGMVSWIGFRQVPFRYARAKRYVGETKYPLRKMIHLAMDAITGFSTQPLRMSMHFAAVLALISIVLLIYTLVGWLYFDTVAGWTSLMVVVLILGCAQTLFLGIIGEYLGRLYMQSKQRPLFVISEIARSAPARAA